MSNTAALQLVDPAELKIREEGEEIIAAAHALVLTTADDYTNAVELGQSIKKSIESVVAYFEPLITPQRASLQALYDRKNAHIHPREEAVQIVKEKAITWKRGERLRLEAEQRALEEKQQKLDDERRLQEAIAREAEGDAAGADEILDEPAPVPFVPVPRPTAPKVVGTAETKRWTFDPKADIAAVIKHIAGISQDQGLAHPELVNVLQLDTKTTRQLVTAMRANFNVPGIRAYEEEGLSLSGR